MTSTALEIYGHCDGRFEAVRDVFASHFEQGLEVGASVAVMLEGRLVVDLWAGHADTAGERPWARDTIVRVFSTTKGVVALCMHMLADRGLVDLDAPVARYWPEFAQAGKERITVAQLLDHSAGLPAVSTRLPDDALNDWARMVATLEAQAPWWEPGADHGYHAVTWGWLNGEVLRRVTGRTPGAFIREQICAPLGIDFYLGFGPELDERVADMVPAPGDPGAAVGAASAGTDRTSMSWNVWNNPPRVFAEANTRASRAAEIPAGNGHGNARGLARLYGALALGGELDGVRLISEAALERAIRPAREGRDAVLGVPMRRSLGFMLHNPERAPDPRSPRAFGHPGAGGSSAFADPEHRLGFAYTMNRVGTPPDTRSASLVGALYGAL
ncbi:MAG: serine hydrolase [Dehalococcoidia bacterium]|nr:serine hydrolase [Dehalococcoidia bacterium]